MGERGRIAPSCCAGAACFACSSAPLLWHPGGRAGRTDPPALGRRRLLLHPRRRSPAARAAVSSVSRAACRAGCIHRSCRRSWRRMSCSSERRTPSWSDPRCRGRSRSTPPGTRSSSSCCSLPACRVPWRPPLAPRAAPDDTLAGRPQWVYLRTGRRCVVPPFVLDGRKGQQLIDSVPAKYRLASVNPSPYERSTAPLLAANPDAWRRVWRGANGTLDVYERVGPATALSALDPASTRIRPLGLATRHDAECVT